MRLKTRLQLWRQRSILFEVKLLRLQHYGLVEAAVALLARRVCGTPVYWYPKREREALRNQRQSASA